MTESDSNEPKLSVAMRKTLAHLAEIDHRNYRYTWNTIRALKKRGLVVTKVDKHGLSIFPTVEGYHAIGEKHPYE